MTQPKSSPETTTWSFGSRQYELGRRPLLMGILNVTPDSFSDGGAFFEPAAAVARARQMCNDGADFIDVGGESTRPGSQPVSLRDELSRVIPVIEKLAGKVPIPISIDTTKAEVARRAVEAGAEIINDVSGLRFDEKMPEVCRESNTGVICMHMRGTPKTMQDDPRYDNVVAEIREFFAQRLAALGRKGIAPERVVLDPGIGFGKTPRHNLDILASTSVFRELGRPVLIGHSRKRFLGKILDREVDERTFGGIGVAVALAEQSVDILRVHDVRAVRDALLGWHAVVEARRRKSRSGN